MRFAVSSCRQAGSGFDIVTQHLKHESRFREIGPFDAGPPHHFNPSSETLLAILARVGAV